MKTLILNDAMETVVSLEGNVTLGKHQTASSIIVGVGGGKQEPIGEIEPVEIEPVDEDYGAIVDEAEIQGDIVILRWGTYQKRISLAEYKALNIDD